MSAPNVSIREIDKSQRVPAFPGVYGGILVLSSKGDSTKPTFVSSDTDFLNRFTPNGRVDVGMSLGLYSALAFLQKSNKLWVIRVDNGSKYGGVVIKRDNLVASIVEVDTVNRKFTLSGNKLDYLTAGSTFYIQGSSNNNKSFTVQSVSLNALSNTEVIVTTEVKTAGFIAEVHSVDLVENYLVFEGDVTSLFQAGGKITVEGSKNNDQTYTVTSATYVNLTDITNVLVVEDIPSSDTPRGSVYGVKGSVYKSLTDKIANISAVSVDDKTFTIAQKGAVLFNIGSTLLVQGSTANDGKYTVVSAANVDSTTVVTVSETIPNATADGGLYRYGNIQMTDVLITSVSAVSQGTKKFTVADDFSSFFHVGDLFRIKGSTGNDGVFTVVSAVYDDTADTTGIVVSQNITSSVADGYIFRQSVADPSTYEFRSDDAMLLSGINQGSWANDIKVNLRTYNVSPTVVKTPDCLRLEIMKNSTGQTVESYTGSRELGKKDGYGRNVFIEDVLKSSNMLQAVDNGVMPSSAPLIEQTTTLQLDGGYDGPAPTSSNMILALDMLNNVNYVPLTVIMDGGFTDPDYQRAIADVCQSRGDCVYCISTPYDAEDNANYTTEIVKYRKDDLNLNNSWGGLYTPHLLIRDKFNDRQIYVSPDGYAAAAISTTAANYEMWFPPAGFRRGLLNVSDTRRRFQPGEMDLLYDAGINPIRFAPGKGIVIWGQKTLSSIPSALDRMNVRLLLIVIEPAIKEFLESFIFELNDDASRLLISSGLELYLQNIKSRGGLYDYRVVCDRSNNTDTDIDNYILNVWVFVQPVKAAEYIPVSVVITRTGYDLALAQNLML